MKEKRSEKRAHRRCNAQGRVELRLKSGVILEGDIDNVSANGILVQAFHSPPVGNPVGLNVCITGSGASFTFRSNGKVVRVGEGTVAITFTDLAPEDAEKIEALAEGNALWTSLAVAADAVAVHGVPHS
jgi:hypothetical protein